MAISVTCPQCAKEHRVADHLAGKSARCPCGGKVRIPEPAVPLLDESSLLDELSASDMTRSQPAITAMSGEAAGDLAMSAPAAVISSVGSEYLERAKSKLSEQREREAIFAEPPSAVKLAVGGLATNGVFSLGGALLVGAMIALEASALFGGPLAASIILMWWLMIGSVGATAAALLHFRARGAWMLGVVAALVGLLGCLPVHWLATFIALLGLFRADTQKWLREGTTA